MDHQERRRIVQQFADSPAWKAYLKPSLTEKAEAIKDKLTRDRPEKETIQLRAQYELLRELITSIPNHISPLDGPPLQAENS